MSDRHISSDVPISSVANLQAGTSALLRKPQARPAPFQATLLDLAFPQSHLPYLVSKHQFLHLAHRHPRRSIQKKMDLLFPMRVDAIWCLGSLTFPDFAASTNAAINFHIAHKMTDIVVTQPSARSSASTKQRSCDLVRSSRARQRHTIRSCIGPIRTS